MQWNASSWAAYLKTLYALPNVMYSSSVNRKYCKQLNSQRVVDDEKKRVYSFQKELHELMTVKNSERFIVAYNRIEKVLSEKADGDEYTPFYRLIDKVKVTNSVVRKYEDDLRELGDLRNAIVHNRTDIDYVIAEPHDEIVERIELIEEKLSNPL